METSPIPPDWQGFPEIMFIIDTTIGAIHDLEQSPVTGVVRTRFIQLIEKQLENWYITPLVKCRPKSTTYSKKTMGDCSYWINEEIKRLGPKIIVGCGHRVEQVVKCNYVCKNPIQITMSGKNEKEFGAILEDIKKELNGNQSQLLRNMRL